MKKQNIVFIGMERFIIFKNIKITFPNDIILQEVTSLWENNSINIHAI